MENLQNSVHDNESDSFLSRHFHNFGPKKYKVPHMRDAAWLTASQETGMEYKKMEYAHITSCFREVVLQKKNLCASHQALPTLIMNIASLDDDHSPTFAHVLTLFLTQVRF